MSLSSLCVFCGSAEGTKPDFMQSADSLGKELIKRNIQLIYGGGNIGLMGQIARSVNRLQGKIHSIVPLGVFTHDQIGESLGQVHYVNSMHERKQTMNQLSDGFIALPGGVGTLEETLEMITWNQLQINNKPLGILNVCGYFDPIKQWFDQAAELGFLKKTFTDKSICWSDDPADLLDQMQARFEVIQKEKIVEPHVLP